ncbi:MAG TPA: TonB-dependent receptor [Blastocatellia bacterium]|nr:TonB-dependent receptor [Blastocatellia bacterium]
MFTATMTKRPSQISSLLSLALIALLSIPAPAQQPRALSTIRVTAVDAAEKPIEGVQLELKTNGKVVGSATTDQKGEGVFANVAPGTYEVAAAKEGLETLTQPDIVIKSNEPVELTFTLGPKAEIKESVDVKANGSLPVDQGASPSTELQRTELKDVPGKPATVADVLPLVPGVVRTPAGELKISGSDENRSSLVVNSIDATDPATGQFGVTVPVDSVETVNVFQTPYLAQFGRFTAGVVSVETRRGGDKWNFELNDPLPEFRIFAGQLRGLRYATPRVVFNGPLIADRLYFSEGLEYFLKKTPVKTLAFPFNESKQESVNSFTQLDYILSPKNTITGTVHVAPWRANFVNLDFYNPQPVTPAFRATDYTGAVTDRLTINNSLLESSLAIKRFGGDVWAQGLADMVLTPVGNLGNYFSQQNRRASRLEWLETYSMAPIELSGSHNLKFGVAISHTNNHGEFTARPVEIRDLDGVLLKQIDFVGGSPFNRSDLETEFFGQDHWLITKNLSLDSGIRFDRQGITGTDRIAPRVGLAWTPFGSDRAVVRGGYGIFYDRVPLGVYSFSSYPQQLVTTFAPDGSIIDGPRLFANITDRAVRDFPFIRGRNTIGNFAPYSATWNVEVDEPISKRLLVRANYLQSNSSGVIIVTPEVVSGQDALVLGGGGKSRYRQLELTARFDWKEGRRLYFTYVRAQAQGDLNQFNNYLGNYPYPLVRTNFYSNLPGDLPNRFLAWGLIQLPWRMRVSPMVEYRSGFPYSAVDAAQNFVGIPNTSRFPNFLSLDARVSKDFKVTDKYTVRFSVSGFNITDHNNPTAVRNNIADPIFGTFFGTYHRHLTADFDVIF